MVADVVQPEKLNAYELLPIQRRAVDRIRQQAISERGLDSANLYLSHRVFKKGDRLPIPIAEGTPIQPQNPNTNAEADAVVVFADGAPGKGWAHHCTYLLYDRQTGRLLREIPERFPPWHCKEGIKSEFRVFHEPVQVAAPRPFLRPLRLDRSGITHRMLAVLFSGSVDTPHLNNLEFLYRVLQGRFGSQLKTRILTRKPDPGMLWPHATQAGATNYTLPNAIDGPGTKSNLQQAIGTLINQAQPEDDILIAITGHGTRENGVICQCAAESSADYDFASPLELLSWLNSNTSGAICRHLAVFMSQCHSGMFGTDVVLATSANRISFAASCRANEESDQGAYFDPFASSWVAALGGTPWFGGTVILPVPPPYSVRNLFDYAAAATETPTIHPVFQDPGFSGSDVLGG